MSDDKKKILTTLLVLDEEINRLEHQTRHLKAARGGLALAYGLTEPGVTQVQTAGRNGAAGDGEALRAGTARGPGKRRRMAVDVRRSKAPPPAEQTDAPEPKEEEAGMDLEKPTTIAGAMKRIIPTLKSPFTVADVIEAVKADPDWKKLLEGDGGETRPYGNLAYWAKTGKVRKTGDGAAALYVNLTF